MIVSRTPTTEGMNSRFLRRFWKTAMLEKRASSSTQKTSDPRWPAQSPVTLKYVSSSRLEYPHTYRYS